MATKPRARGERSAPPSSVISSADSAADSLLVDLDPQQREVASRPLGPMRVLAGAGTGKTRAIIHRIAYGVRSGAYQPQRVLAVTYTARAAGEMRTRLRDLGVVGVQSRTFHAAALRQLHFFWPECVGGGVPGIAPHKAPLVAEAAARLRLTLDRAGIRDVAEEIEWAKVSLLTNETYPAAARTARRDPPGLDHVAMARLLRTYEDVKSSRGVVDFEDVLLLTIGILKDRPDIAEQVRAQYRHFVVDEYQDVNPVQQRLLDLWVGDRHDVCVVGDPAQTIYSFTGASARHLLDFPSHHPGTRTVRLTSNYRSSPEIIALANLVLRGSSQPWASIQLSAQQPRGLRPAFSIHDDDEDEAAGVAQAVAALVAHGTDPADVAVLFRTNAQSEAIEAALARVGVPYLVRGGERFFMRPEVRQAVRLLRAAARSDDVSRPLPDLVGDILGSMGWTSSPPAGGASRDQWESLSALIHLAEELITTDSQARLPSLVAELAQREEAQHAPPMRGVTLASLHAAKGLEWDAVFLTGCSEGLLPITMADTSEALEEERRLFYVGVTRARRILALSMARSRGRSGRGSRRPSRFLDSAARVLDTPSAQALRRGGSARSTSRDKNGGRRTRTTPAICRSCGKPLEGAAECKVGRCGQCPPTYDESVFRNLQEWRRSVAAAERVRPYLVFTNATLVAIAERAPGSTQELAEISGVGPDKLRRYGTDVLALVGGAALSDLVLPDDAP